MPNSQQGSSDERKPIKVDFVIPRTAEQANQLIDAIAKVIKEHGRQRKKMPVPRKMRRKRK